MIPEIEMKNEKEIQHFQNELLQKQIAYLVENSPFYQRKFKAENIQIGTIKTIADLQKISVTNKADVQLNNDDFFCVPKHEILDYATTSGTLGDPVTFGLTDNDLDRLAYNEMLSFQCAGVQK